MGLIKMVSLLIGKKGSGKTKRMINLAHDAVDASKGVVVSVEKGDTLTFDIDYRVRLINIIGYEINDFDALYGFIAGLLAGNYDITDILVDSTLKIGGCDLGLFTDFVTKITPLAEKSGAKLVFSVSAAKDELPEALRDAVTII